MMSLEIKLIALLLVIALLVVMAFAGYRAGARSVQVEWDQAKNQAALHAANTDAAQAKAAVQVVTEYVDRVRVIEAKAKTIIKKVPVYVTQAADQHCTVNNGFVSLHNLAAGMSEPSGTAGTPDAPAAGITLSGVADTVSDNYGRCGDNAEQLIALQNWVRSTYSAMASR